MSDVIDLREFKRRKADADVWRQYYEFANIFEAMGGSIAPLGRAFREDKFRYESVRQFLEVDAEDTAFVNGGWGIRLISNLDRAYAGRPRHPDDPTEPEVYAVFRGNPNPVNMSERMVGIKPVEILVAYSHKFPEVNNACMMIPACDALVEYWDRGFVVMDYDMKHGDRKALLLTLGHRDLGEVTLTFYFNVLVEDNRILERLDKEEIPDEE